MIMGQKSINIIDLATPHAIEEIIIIFG